MNIIYINIIRCKNICLKKYPNASCAKEYGVYFNTINLDRIVENQKEYAISRKTFHIITVLIYNARFMKVINCLNRPPFQRTIRGPSLLGTSTLYKNKPPVCRLRHSL